jgi:hypothetical protein
VRAAARVGATLGPVVWGLAVRQLSSRPPAAVLRANARRVYGRGSVAAATALEWLAYSRMTHDLAQLRAVTEPPAVPVVVLRRPHRLRDQGVPHVAIATSGTP